ncbi:type I polyketide synthase [Streptomyces morookaense]|nr:type I polyketide synthase [Streptomyces morookaense]GHF47154.1 type I polyketide synthase [Streptomyces morookaense]
MGMDGSGRSRSDRSVAVVGASCRLPGGIDDLDALWQALREGRDLVTEVPADRFDVLRFVDPSMPRPGKSYTGAGGFLTDIRGFDADYFGIAPKEAVQMDPQQRILLELAAEACDDAGISPQELAGSDTAVFVGIADHSYGALQMLMTESVNAYTMSGAASSIAANRVSHFLDLRGPSLAVDTACSSSLVALVQACRTLLAGESRAALVGGVNLLLSPYHYVGFCQASMLSPTGRCRSFSAGADGYVRAEGGGMVLLKRLADAVADGDRIRAVIVDGASNSDGRTAGLALPRKESQESLLRQVYDRAGIDPDDIAYLEAHGTGTPVGDPVECEAIGRALGIRRTREPLPIGSVKSNLGHLEPASGIAGLLKALLVLQHGTIPPTLHATPPNPHVDFAALRLAPAVECRATAVGEQAVVGVNSFGFGGTNAHVILAAPPPAPAVAAPDGTRPFVISAASRQALIETARRTAGRLKAAGPGEFYDLAWTACRRRGRRAHAAAVLAADPADAAAQLSRLADTLAPPAAEGEHQERKGERGEDTGTADSPAVADHVAHGRIVFAFSGNGAQWAGMGADLLASDPVFAEAVESADKALFPHTCWSVASALADPDLASRLSDTAVAQPLLFAVQVAVVEVLRQRGVRPAAVVGHSVGEVAAAYTAGALTLEQAARVIAARGRAQAATAGTGRMAAVSLSREEAEKALEGRPQLEIACVNTPRDVTVSGPAGRLAELRADLAREGVACTLLDVDRAFHSPAMDPVKQPLKAALDGLSPAPVRIPMVSTVNASFVKGTELGSAYWWRNVRRPVLFAHAVQHLLGKGHDVFVDIGPHPILQPYLRRLTEKHKTPVAVVPTLAKATDGPAALEHTVATLAAAGARIDWNVHFPVLGRVTSLPAYPWQRTEHWNGSPGTWAGTSGDGGVDHPLLGDRMPLHEPTWHGPVEPVLVPWLADHRVGGSVVLPATGYAEMALAAGRRVLGGPAELKYLEILRVLPVPWENPGSVRLFLTLSPDDGAVTVTSTAGRTGEPSLHARGRVRRLLRPRPAPLDVAAVRERCRTETDPQELYTTVAAAGLDYGPAFRPLRTLCTGDGEVLAAYRHDAPSDAYEVHPALLDGALQSGLPLMADALKRQLAYLPGTLDAVRVWQTPPAEGLYHLRERGRTPTEVCWDITVTDADGTVMAEVEGCRLRRFAGLRGTPLTRHAIVMRAQPRPDVPPARTPLPAPSAVLEAAQPRIAELCASWRSLWYDRVRRMNKEITALGAAEVFAGALTDAAAPFTLDDVVDAEVSRPHHRRLGELMLPLLERHALAHRGADGRWLLVERTTTLQEQLRRFVRDFPAYGTEIALSAYCVQRLERVLSGDDDPLEFVAHGAAELTERFFDIAPWSRFHNRLMQALVSAMTRQWPDDRPLRILEVGAGTGGTTAALLPLLPPERTRYVFTDVSPLFLGRAEKRFSDYDFVEYRTFDLDRPPAEQGLIEGGFDLIVGANALHAAKDLALALRRVNSLLAPCGQLLALELHDVEILAQSFGTLESFWNHTDRELRPGPPLLSARRWQELLEECGFTGVVRTGDERRAAGSDGSVLLAAAPERPVPQAPLPAADGTDGTTAWIVAAESADSGPLPGAVARALHSTGGSVRCAAAAADTPEQWEELIPRDADAVAVVLVLDPADGGRTPDGLLDLATRRAAVLRALAVACDRLPGRVRPALWLVAGPSGALPAPERAAVPEDAAAWGVTRTLANEHPRLTVRRLSLDRSADDPDGDARRVARELLDASDEDEIALTARGRFVPRTTDVTAAPQGTADSRDVPAFALEVRDPGLAYRLAWTETDPPPEPGPGEVVLAVHAAALNYRDVMQAAGVLPPVEAAQRLTRQPGPGMECSGTVTAVGPGVTSVAVGDRVFGLAPGTFASHTVTTEHALGRMPAGMTFPEAATLPVVLLTVHYALGHLARLSEGETVLVHGGAGGVGLAALQFARRRGAHVIATAGTEAKRSLLRMLGVGHVLDSRSMDFAERIRELTAGRGVDVVLNSLAGEAVERGLEALRPGGRFVELGKRDIHEDKPLRLRPFTRNIAFFGVDLSELLHDPELARRQFAEVVALVRCGRYRPLLHTVHPAARVTEAFRLMQHSRHVGKVVVAFDPLDEPLMVERALHTPEFDPQGTYLVTGGLGGFGAATARWLGARGARRLALVGRRGPESPEAADLVAELAARGVETKVYAADVCDAAAMQRIVEEAETDGRPLRGVVHSAMHLDDALLTRLTDERFRSVLAAKLGGGAVLDAVTRGRPLDLFLVYSSLVASVGHIGQSPYVAGNLYLEALARKRRQEGLPALAVAWGALGETGYVARNCLQDTMTQFGMEPVMPHEAFEALEESLTAQHDVAGCGRYNWAALAGLLAGAAAPRLAGLVPVLDAVAAPSRQDILRKLSGMSPEQAEQYIADSLTQKLAEVAQLPPEQIDHRRRIDTYGVDSLMATEVLTSLRQQYDIDIPPMELLRSEGTITDIARIIRLRLGLGSTDEATVPALPPARQHGEPSGPAEGDVS